MLFKKKKIILGSIHYSIGFNKDQQIKPFFISATKVCLFSEAKAT